MEMLDSDSILLIVPCVSILTVVAAFLFLFFFATNQIYKNNQELYALQVREQYNQGLQAEMEEELLEIQMSLIQVYEDQKNPEIKEDLAKAQEQLAKIIQHNRRS